jgi:putative peptidoglycan lipid II flippase
MREYSLDEAHAESQPSQEETNAGVARASGVVALGNVASRVLGLAREVVLTNLFGASRAVDAFNVAIIVPKALFDLLIGGQVNSALVPVLSEVVAKEGRKALWQLVSVLCSIVTILMALIMLALELFAGQIVRLVGSGFDAATLELATRLLQLTAPALIFLGLFAVLSGTLYALREFTWPALAATVFNGSIVLISLLFAPQISTRLVQQGYSFVLESSRPTEGIIVVTFGWLFGALAQMLIQLPGMRDARLRLTLYWRNPAIRQIIRLYTPVMFSLVMDTLVIRTFSYNLASQTGEGSIGYMTWATTLIQFPQGLVATAISIAILPTLARQAALITETAAFKDTLGLGLRLTTTLILPATIGLLVLAQPIVMLLFQHGAFNAFDTQMTAQALRLYLIGLPFAALDLLLVYAFYARQDTFTPALIGVISLAVYMLTAILLFPRFGLFSLMLADSVKHIVHASISALLLARRMQGFGSQRLWITFLKTGIAAGLMGMVGYFITPQLTRIIGDDTFIREAILVLVAGGLSTITFVVCAWLLKIEELRWITRLVVQRLSPRSK